MHSRTYQAVSSALAAVIGAGAVFTATEIGRNTVHPPPPAAGAAVAASPSRARLVPAIRPPGHQAVTSGSPQPALAANLQHSHDAYQCPAHADGCTCPGLGNCMCNPYHAAGYCPDSIEVMPVVNRSAR